MTTRFEIYRDGNTDSAGADTYAVRNKQTGLRCSCGRLTIPAVRMELATLLRGERRERRDARARKRREIGLAWMRDDTDHSGF